MGDCVECTSNPSQVWDKEAGVCSHQNPNYYLIKLLPGVINLSHFRLALGHVQLVPRVREKTLCRKSWVVVESSLVGVEVRPGSEESESFWHCLQYSTHCLCEIFNKLELHFLSQSDHVLNIVPISIVC